MASTTMVREIGMEDPEIRAALDHHWAASDADDFETEHDNYRDDAVPRISAIGRAHPQAAQHSGVAHGVP